MSLASFTTETGNSRWMKKPTSALAKVKPATTRVMAIEFTHSPPESKTRRLRR
jgi:hypothetical protein